MKLAFVESLEATAVQLELVANLAQEEGSAVIAGRARGLSAFMSGYARQARIIYGEPGGPQLALLDTSVGRRHDGHAA